VHDSEDTSRRGRVISMVQNIDEHYNPDQRRFTRSSRGWFDSIGHVEPQFHPIAHPQCERCGCNRLQAMEFDETDGRFRYAHERTCFCDTCHTSGCSWEEAASWPEPPVCSVCVDAVPDIAAIAKRHAEQWGNKRVCDHRFCSECLVGWIAACIAGGNPHVRCPDADCTCTLLPDDVARISPAHVERMHDLLNRDFAARAAEVADDPELLAVFKQFAQQCPTCSLWVGRSEGCNSMVCLCGAHFCYQCGQDDCDGGCERRAHDDGAPEGYGNALFGEYLQPSCIDCSREMRREWVPPGADRPEAVRCFDCEFAADTAAGTGAGGCMVCGCSAEFDAATAERICFCDPCCHGGGCIFDEDAAGAAEGGTAGAADSADDANVGIR